MQMNLAKPDHLNPLLSDTTMATYNIEPHEIDGDDKAAKSVINEASALSHDDLTDNYVNPREERTFVS